MPKKSDAIEDKYVVWDKLIVSEDDSRLVLCLCCVQMVRTHDVRWMESDSRAVYCRLLHPADEVIWICFVLQDFWPTPSLLEIIVSFWKQFLPTIYGYYKLLRVSMQ